jgi:elongation factor P--beta-lysine ligase
LPVPEKILELVDRFESDIDKYKSLSYNEEDIKIDFINPLLALPSSSGVTPGQPICPSPL